MATVSVRELRDDLEGVLERVAEGDEVVVVRDGEPVAVLAHPSVLRDVEGAEQATVPDEVIRRWTEVARKRSDTEETTRGESGDSMLEKLRDDWESRH